MHYNYFILFAKFFYIFWLQKKTKQKKQKQREQIVHNSFTVSESR